MVLFISCPTSSLVSSHSTTDLYYELSTPTTTGGFVGHQKSQPIPVRNHAKSSWDDEYSTSPLERLPSPLATSAESVDSIKSSCSSRSSAERELERAQRRQLLDMSLGKMRSQNMPMRKHLLVFNTVKALQRDLDMLDDEDLYCSLVGMTNEAVVSNEGMKMEVDECCWLKQQSSPRVELDSVMIDAPPKREELDFSPKSQSVTYGNICDDFEMENIDSYGDVSINTETKTWSWSDDFHSDSNGSMDALFKWSASSCSADNGMNNWASEDSLNFMNSGSDSSWSRGATDFDMWGSSDPFASARFDFQHLFPSQLLLQA